MRNVIILGSGRSGTSAVAGSLARSDYFFGDNLLNADQSNPKGFFEDRDIIRINEAILASVLRSRPKLLGRWFFHSRPFTGHRWIAGVPLDTDMPCPVELSQKMRKLSEREPYCIKDPRFSYTLPVWRPFLKDPGYICVFRDPAITAVSILKLVKDRISPYQKERFTFDQALDSWTLIYRHILERHRSEGVWLFVHYNQLFTAEGVARIEAFLGVPVDHSFPEASLRRSNSDRPVSKEVLHTYKTLCELAEYVS